MERNKHLAHRQDEIVNKALNKYKLYGNNKKLESIFFTYYFILFESKFFKYEDNGKYSKK